MTTLLLAPLLACGGTTCPEGQVRDGGTCVDYVAGEPEPAGDAWQPAPGTSWQWQLTGTVDPAQVPDVQMVDLDLFDAPAETLATLQADGRVVICYFSAGSWEDWRPDADLFPAAAIGDPLDGWEGEAWLDIMDPTVRELVQDRLDLAVDQGCDGVEPDNVDGYDNGNGLGINATEQLDYNRFLADQAHRRGLSVGLKNDLDQLEALEPWFDWALNEECVAYDECDRMAVFTGVDKAVFHVEYVDDWAEAEALESEVCGQAPLLDTLIKTWDLGPEWLACG
jgi:hypothetical protein